MVDNSALAPELAACRWPEIQKEALAEGVGAGGCGGPGHPLSRRGQCCATLGSGVKLVLHGLKVARGT